MSAAFLNEVANHPDVRPHLGGDGVIDLSNVLADTNNVALVGEGGGFVLTKHDAGVYEAHSMFLPGSEGAVEAMREGFRYLFGATDCIEVWTKCPDENRPALGLARAGGFRESFRREGVSHQTLTLDRWRATDPTLAELGEWFHHRLEEAKTQAGSERPVHADDEAHDRAVGAAVLMFRAGNPLKAVWSYNRWAQFAGYALIALLSERPAVVDIQDAIVGVNGQDMDVLLCR